MANHCNMKQLGPVPANNATNCNVHSASRVKHVNMVPRSCKPHMYRSNKIIRSHGGEIDGELHEEEDLRKWKKVKRQLSEMKAKLKESAGALVLPAVRRFDGFLTNGEAQVKAYTALSSTAAIAAALALLVPGAVTTVLFRAPIDPVVTALMRTSGAALIPTAVSAYLMRVAVEHEQLDSDTFRRLNCALAFQSLMLLVVLAQAVSVRNAALIGIAGTLSLASLITTSRVYALSKRSPWPLPHPASIISSLLSLLQPGNTHAAVYSVMSICFGVAALCYFKAHPSAPSMLFHAQMGPIVVFLSRVNAGSAALAAVVSLCLRDAAQRARLGAATAAALNAALAASCALQALILFAAVFRGFASRTPQFWLILLSNIAGSAWCAYHYGAHPDPE